jgi:predicted enzyme related to lactoylglutathione lyase
MTSTIGSITVDCADPYPLAAFWREVTGFPIDSDCGPDDVEVGLVAPDGHPGILFIRVPEGKSVKNRVHLDIVPQATTRDDEVARLVRLGATLVDDRRQPDGRGWVVLADPAGNEFCVERGPLERQAAAAG